MSYRPTSESIGTARSASAQRYFIGTDDSCHYYLVPVERRDEWRKWEAFQSTDSDKWTDEEADYAWSPPDYAKCIDSWSMLTFTDPKEDNHST